MKRKLFLVLSLLLSVGLLAACGSKPGNVYSKNQPAAKQPPEPTVTLKIGQIPTIDGLPFWVAASKDYYRQQGVNVELVSFKAANERDTALTGGLIDGTLTDIIGAASLHAKGTKLQIASINLGVTQEEGPFAIIAAPNSGITSPDQLKGVEIGISTNSVIQYVTEKLLLENGFKPDEIKTTNIAQIPVRFEALMAGQIKAATLPEPFLSLAVAKGGKVILNDAEARENYSQSVIVFTEKAVKEKAEGIKRFFAAYNMAVVDIKLEPQAYKELLAEKAKLPPEIKDSWKVMTFSPAQAPGKAEVEAVVAWLLEKKVIDAKVPYEEIVNKTFVSKAP